MRLNWTTEEFRIVAEVAYFPVLHAERAGQRVIKNEFLREAEGRLPGRTLHTIKLRCYQISEVLRDEGYPWVEGWKPPGDGGQNANSPGVTAIIRNAVLPIARRDFGSPS